MTTSNFEAVACLECKKEFRRRKHKSNSRLNNEIRKIGSKTCSRKCSSNLSLNLQNEWNKKRRGQDKARRNRLQKENKDGS